MTIADTALVPPPTAGPVAPPDVPAPERRPGRPRTHAFDIATLHAAHVRILAGASARQVAEDLDVPVTTLRRHLNEAGILDGPFTKPIPSRNRIPSDQLAALTRAHANGQSVRALAKEHQIPYSTLWESLNQRTAKREEEAQ